jgi:hypothetical protein
MHWIFAAVRFFPYAALPLVLIFYELGMHFRRRGMRKGFLFAWAIAGFFVLLTGVWFAFRGEIHSDAWVRSFFRLNQ